MIVVNQLDEHIFYEASIIENGLKSSTFCSYEYNYVGHHFPKPIPLKIERNGTQYHILIKLNKLNFFKKIYFHV